jgi:hypothetical protein
MRCSDEDVVKYAVDNGRLISLDEPLNEGEIAIAILICECPNSGNEFKVVADVDEQVKRCIDEIRDGSRPITASNNVRGAILCAVNESELMAAGVNSSQGPPYWEWSDY